MTDRERDLIMTGVCFLVALGFHLAEFWGIAGIFAAVGIYGVYRVMKEL